MRRHFLPLLLFFTSAIASAASDDQSVANVANDQPVVMDPVVVSTTLDLAREDIVPSLGATTFEITKLQIDALPLPGTAGFNEVLLRTPGAAQDSFGQLHLRGEHANLQYRINDVLLPEGIAGFGQELDPRFVKSAALLTGALPAQYGYRTAGVVDIHTQNGSANPGGDVALTAGSFGTFRAGAETSGTTGHLSAYGTVSDETNNLGIENPVGTRTALHDRTRQTRLFGYVSDVIDATSRLNLMISGSLSRFQIPDNPGLPPAYTLAGVTGLASARLDENQREDNAYAILSYQKTADDFSAQVSAFSRYSLLNFTPDRAGDLVFNGVASAVRRGLTGAGAEADLRWAATLTHTLRGGAIVTATNAGTRTTTTVFPVDATGAQTSTTPIDIAGASRKLGWLCGVYLQDEWRPRSGLTLNYGARADASRAYLRESQLSPRANLVYQLTDATSVHLGYARYFTPPPLELVQQSDLANFAGTTNAPAVTVSSAVRAERSHYFDAGISHQFSPVLSATLDAYAKRATDQLDEGQFGQALIFSPFNYARGQVEGLELSTNYTHEGFSAYANIALSHATGRTIASGEFQFAPDELAFIAAHDVHLDHDQRLTASAGSTYQVGATTFSVDLLYGSGLRRGFANTAHLPEYHALNAGVAHTFKPDGKRQLIVKLDVVNVLDEIYELRDGSGIGVSAPQFGQRRGLFGGLTLTF